MLTKGIIMTKFITTARTQYSPTDGIGIIGDSKGQVFRKLVQLNLDPDDYNIISCDEPEKEGVYKAPVFLLQYQNVYINITQIISMETVDNVTDYYKYSEYDIFGNGNYALKIKMKADRFIFRFTTQDERQKFIENMDERLYNITTYRRTFDGGC